MKRHSLKASAVARARAFRQASTPEERTLWQTLRRHPAAKFRRQVPIGPYFVDFISHGAKLVIELDGSQHADRVEFDAERSRFLEREGYRVIRFWNRDVAANLDGVVRAIEAALTPSPLVGAPGSGPSPRRPDPAAGGPKDRMRGEAKEPLTPCPLPQGEREVSSKSPILEL